MKKVLVVLCFWFMFSVTCAFSTDVVRGEGFRNSINFGSITAMTETTCEEIFDISLQNSKVKALDISVESVLQSDTGNIVPVERLTVTLNENTQNLSLTPSRIILPPHKGKDGLQHYPFYFRLTLLPQDSPGVYTANVKISPILENEKVDETQISELGITFEVAKWFSLSTPNSVLTIKSPPIPGSCVISSLFPYDLQIAANGPWKLFIFQDETEELSAIQEVLKVKLSPTDTPSYHAVCADGIALSTEPVLLAQGVSTVNEDQCWVKLPIFLEVENFTVVPTGRYEIPLYFVVVEGEL